MRKILKSYLFWTYPRGSFHYDVMVTLILAFIFLSPRVINYRERPQEAFLAGGGVVVRANGNHGLTYDIGAGQIGKTRDEPSLRQQLQERIEAISGAVELDRYSAQRDSSGRVTGYRVWAHR